MSAHTDGTEWLEITPDERAAIHSIFDLEEEMAILLNEAEIPTCIFRRNYFSGMGSSHKRLCCYADCAEDATFHVWSPGWCANTCKSHATRFLKTHPRAELSETIYLEGAAV